MSPQTIYDEVKDFEKRCNDRRTPLNLYQVFYTEVNNKGETVVIKTFVATYTPTHIVVYIPTAVKIELLGDCRVFLGQIINPPKIGEETDEVPVEAPAPAPHTEDQIVHTTVDGQRRIPFLAGLALCRQCKHSPFKNPARKCTGNGHRFDHDFATKRCDKFEFPE